MDREIVAVCSATGQMESLNRMRSMPVGPWQPCHPRNSRRSCRACGAIDEGRGRGVGRWQEVVPAISHVHRMGSISGCIRGAVHTTARRIGGLPSAGMRHIVRSSGEHGIARSKRHGRIGISYSCPDQALPIAILQECRTGEASQIGTLGTMTSGLWLATQPQCAIAAPALRCDLQGKRLTSHPPNIPISENSLMAKVGRCRRVLQVRLQILTQSNASADDLLMLNGCSKH